MGPKTQRQAAGKGKKSAVVDGLSTEDMSKDQLEEHIIRLREELEREREEKSYFQLERDKMQAFWETSRRALERARDMLRHREREREEAEERHRVEINVYKQKLKHVLSEHHVTISELKMDAAAAAALTHDRHTESELGLRELVQNQQADAREKRCHDQNSIKEVKLKHKVALLELTNDYDRRLAEIEVKYHKKMQLMVDAEGKRRRAEVSEVEDRMNARIVALMDEHERALRGVEEYYSALQTKALADEKTLKEEAAEVQKQLSAVNSALSAAQQQNKRLRGSLQETQHNLSQLQRQLHDHKQAGDDMVKNSARLKVTEKELRDLKVERELLLQAFEQVQQERDELLKKHTDAIVELQQRSGLKELLLQKKLEALTQTVEKNEAQLCATLSATAATDQNSGCRAAHKLEEILASKRVALGTVQEDLSRERQEYDRLVLSCTQTLDALNVPRHVFPSAKQILNEPSPTR
ncbi:dynein regulatory complex subunit 4-like [Solea senegalensis]|uniref:Dynein regulatory complex subunit 4 n=1 Tax=Solea senegalensis TaxID=28829 RepID=A0AAV6P9K3_SOLSE|nr:dynein regulatory complex subunit 4-like [Solea senegalensis]KAG7453692.1 dynein regulatory complex subunit 4-like [Solea senegalensis]